MKTIYNQIKAELKDKTGLVNCEDYMDMTPDIFPAPAVDAMWNNREEMDATFSVEVSKMSREELVQRLYAAMRMYDEACCYAVDAQMDAMSARQLYREYTQSVERIYREACDLHDEVEERKMSKEPMFRTI